MHSLTAKVIKGFVAIHKQELHSVSICDGWWRVVSPQEQRGPILGGLEQGRDFTLVAFYFGSSSIEPTACGKGCPLPRSCDVKQTLNMSFHVKKGIQGCPYSLPFPVNIPIFSIPAAAAAALAVSENQKPE